MKILVFIQCGLLLAATGCNNAKPTEEQCAKVVDHIRELTSQMHDAGGGDPKRAIRSCRARSTRETVACQMKATNLDQLAACEGEEGKKYLEAQQKAENAATKKAAAATPPAATPPAAPAPTATP